MSTIAAKTPYRGVASLIPRREPVLLFIDGSLLALSDAKHASRDRKDHISSPGARCLTCGDNVLTLSAGGSSRDPKPVLSLVPRGLRYKRVAERQSGSGRAS